MVGLDQISGDLPHAFVNRSDRRFLARKRREIDSLIGRLCQIG